MQPGVARRTRGDGPVAEPEDAADTEPHVAGEERERDEAGKPGPAHRAARDVEAEKPQRVADERGARDSDPGVRVQGAEHEPGDEQRGETQEEETPGPCQPSERGELEPLARDREHEEARPPRDDLEERLPARPEDVSRHPERRPEPEHGRRGRRVGAQDREEEADEDDAGQHEHELADALAYAGGKQRDAGDRAGRGQVAPRPAQRDRPLERDHRAEEAEDHERSVQLDEVGAALRKAPAHALEAAVDADRESGDPERKERKAGVRDPHG